MALLELEKAKLIEFILLLDCFIVTLTQQPASHMTFFSRRRCEVSVLHEDEHSFAFIN